MRRSLAICLLEAPISLSFRVRLRDDLANLILAHSALLCGKRIKTDRSRENLRKGKCQSLPKQKRGRLFIDLNPGIKTLMGMCKKYVVNGLFIQAYLHVTSKNRYHFLLDACRVEIYNVNQPNVNPCNYNNVLVSRETCYSIEVSLRLHADNIDSS